MKCGQCNFKTPFQLTMDNHRFAKHGIGWGRSPICCPFCTYNVYQWGRMFDHLLSHNEEDEKRGAEKLREPAAVDLPPWHILSCRGEEREAPRSQERRLSLLAKRRKGPERLVRPYGLLVVVGLLSDRYFYYYYYYYTGRSAPCARPSSPPPPSCGPT